MEEITTVEQIQEITQSNNEAVENPLNEQYLNESGETSALILETLTDIKEIQTQQLTEIQEIKEIEFQTYTYTVYLLIAVIAFSAIRIFVSHFNSVIG